MSVGFGKSRLERRLNRNWACCSVSVSLEPTMVAGGLRTNPGFPRAQPTPLRKRTATTGASWSHREIALHYRRRCEHVPMEVPTDLLAYSRTTWKMMSGSLRPVVPACSPIAQCSDSPPEPMVSEPECSGSRGHSVVAEVDSPQHSEWPHSEQEHWVLVRLRSDCYAEPGRSGAGVETHLVRAG